MSNLRNTNHSGLNFAALYDAHGEYVARRVPGSYEHQQVLIEVLEFKIPNLLAVCWNTPPFSSVLEIGCATGELIGNFPTAPGGRRVGCDISIENVNAAQLRYRDVNFIVGDGSSLGSGAYDCVILSDILEHVEDDVGLLRRGAELGRYVLLNLPLEDKWISRGRNYGPSDRSGHLRAYSRETALDLLRRAGVRTLGIREVWIHETSADLRRRELRRCATGYSYSGHWLARAAKGSLMGMARLVRPFGRRLLASNLFAMVSL